MWSTAPYLLNNSVGRFDPSPSVEARMGSFQDSITKLLWPEKREKDAVLGDKVPGIIDRTTATSWFRIPSGYLPEVVRNTRDVLDLFVPVFDQKGLELGHAAVLELADEAGQAAILLKHLQGNLHHRALTLLRTGAQHVLQ